MSKNKPPQAPKKHEHAIVRSTAAEYLSFVAASGQGAVEAVYADENVWLTQKMMGTLYDVETHTINYHLKKVFGVSELDEDSVIRNFRITAADSKSYKANSKPSGSDLTFDSKYVNSYHMTSNMIRKLRFLYMLA